MNHPRQTILVAISLVILLSSCLVSYSLGPEWGLNVTNGTRLVPEHPDIATKPCLGGLEGKITFLTSGVVLASGAVGVGSSFDENVEHKGKVYDTLTIEAWCYGEGQVEEGYVKRETTISEVLTSSRGLVLIFPPTGEPSLLCTTPTEQRGQRLPCIDGINFVR